MRATAALLPARSRTAVSGSWARSAISQPGSRYSAIVMEAATVSRESRRSRSALTPASKDSADSTMRRAQSVTSTPASVSREPLGERSSRVTPSIRSMARSRALAAGWLTPVSRAARPTLPSRATASSSSSAPRSGTRRARPPDTPSLSLIGSAYVPIGAWPLLPAPAPEERGRMTASARATAETDSPASAPPAVAEHPPGPRLRALGPNWYAAVMGTAIVATAGTVLPLHPPRALLEGVWALAAAALAVLLAARGAHWLRHRDRARAHLLDPAVAPFHGCLAMALLAVGGGASALDVPWATGLDAALWTSGTAVGLVARGDRALSDDHPAPGGAGQRRTGLAAAGGGPDGLRRARPAAGRTPARGPGTAGPAAGLLRALRCEPAGDAAVPAADPLPAAAPRPAADGADAVAVPGARAAGAVDDRALGNLADAQPGMFGALSVLYGVPVLGFALLWLALSSALVVRAARRGMAFSLTWWAFTFPVGTCVTGAAAVWRHTGAAAFGWLAAGLYVLLVAAWAAAATGTVRGLLSGALLAGPHRAPAAPAPATARTR